MSRWIRTHSGTDNFVCTEFPWGSTAEDLLTFTQTYI